MVLIDLGGKSIETIALECFRPLAGIMVLICRVYHYDTKDDAKLFPSPCGDYGSYLVLFQRLWEYSKFAVSVPLRGLWFLSTLILKRNQKGQCLFPSPCGDYGSYLKHFKKKCYISKRVSVPLRGLWFLSGYIANAETMTDAESFRPLAGIMVLISSRILMPKSKTALCFRPLAGIMVLITKARPRSSTNRA